MTPEEPTDTASKTPASKTPATQAVQVTSDALVPVRDDAGDSLTSLVREPLTRASLARAQQHLDLRHPSDLFLLFRWLVRGSWAVTKHQTRKLIDYGSSHDLTLIEGKDTDGTGESKVSVPVNYAVGVSVFFPMAALLVWLFTKVSDYEFAVTEGQNALPQGSSLTELPSTQAEGAR